MTAGATRRNGFDRYFEISARGSTVGREIRGGLATDGGVDDRLVRPRDRGYFLRGALESIL